MGCDFTLRHYREILEAALESGYVFRGFHQSELSDIDVVYLRHDVDICLEETLNMAAVEADLGVCATYFILVNSPVYNPLARDSLDVLHDISAKGHWIGIHIDPELFLQESFLDTEQHIFEWINLYEKSRIPLVPVVSFHRPHSDVLRRDFNSFINTYSPRFFSDIKYISDSRGVWREGCPCQVLKERRYPALQILVHPIWWQWEKESLVDRLSCLLSERIGSFEQYLGFNVEPIGRLLRRRDK